MSAVIERRRRLLLIGGIGMLVSVAIAFLVPTEFTSTAQLMPLDQQTFSNVSALNSPTGASISVPNLGGGNMFSQITPDAIAIAILSSSTVQDDIINRFNLRRVYHRKLYIDARDVLTKQTTLAENMKTGFITIAVQDRDRYRARDIAQAYVEELDRLINSLSTSSARREREFLEGRLQSIKSQLNSDTMALSQFSSRNATLDVQKQGETAVEAVSKLQEELIAAEGDLSALQASYSSNNVRVRAARARIEKLQSQLRAMGGLGGKMYSSELTNDELIPSVRQIPLLGINYSKLSRQVGIDETLYETLTKEYELARVQEAKDIPRVKVVDAPEVAEKKSSPHRVIIVAIGTLLSICIGAAWIIFVKLREILRKP